MSDPLVADDERAAAAAPSAGPATLRDLWALLPLWLKVAPVALSALTFMGGKYVSPGQVDDAQEVQLQKIADSLEVSTRAWAKVARSLADEVAALRQSQVYWSTLQARMACKQNRSFAIDVGYPCALVVDQGQMLPLDVLPRRTYPDIALGAPLGAQLAGAFPPITGSATLQSPRPFTATPGAVPLLVAMPASRVPGSAPTAKRRGRRA